MHTKKHVGVVTTVAGDGTSGYVDGHGSVAKFNYPWSLAANHSDGSILVADSGNQRIRKISPSGIILFTAFCGL